MVGSSCSVQPYVPAPRIIGSPYARLSSELTDLRGRARGNPRGAALWSSAWSPNGCAAALVRRIFGFCRVWCQNGQ